MAAKVENTLTPALFTQAAIGPKAASICAAAARNAAESVTSAW